MAMEQRKVGHGHSVEELPGGEMIKYDSRSGTILQGMEGCASFQQYAEPLTASFQNDKSDTSRCEGVPNE